MDPLFPPPPFSSLPPGAGALEATAPAPPQNHVAASPALPQPPYADMIYAAITALKEKDGSSKQAITKYIEKEFGVMLPEGYAVSLTQHLKRLKNSGLLVLNKKSYMLPGTRSEAVAAPNPPAAANGSYASAPAEVGFLQGLYQQQQQQMELMFPPGIPPNLFTNPFQQQFAGVVQAPASAPLGAAEGSSVGVKRGRGRPPKPKHEVHSSGGVQVPLQGGGVGAEVNDAAQPVFVALGLADDPTKVAKRRPGRPKKVAVAGEDGGAGAPVTETMPQQQVMKRGRGRPPRNGAGEVGMPRKPESVTDVDPALTNAPPKPRGRGRPRKGVVVPGVGGIMSLKRMVRPSEAFAGVNKPRTRSGRPVGRPRKYLVLPNEAHQSDSGPQSEGYEDMRKKLEFFQSRIMHAVQVLKPEFRIESSHDAIKAIQELEGLASVDITTPFIEDPQPAAAPPPPQQS